MYAHSEPMASTEALLSLARHPKCLAIGETGLDYHYTKASAREQQDSFRVHIEAAQASDLPLVIHARAADADMARLLQDAYRNKAFRGVMHCFSSGAALAHAALELGLYLSMSGIATFPKSQALRDIFAAAPIDRILVETDAPYLAPPPYRGKPNEPAFVVYVARCAAETFGMDYRDFAAQSEANFERLFTKAQGQREAQAGEAPQT